MLAWSLSKMPRILQKLKVRNCYHSVCNSCGSLTHALASIPRLDQLMFFCRGLISTERFLGLQGAHHNTCVLPLPQVISSCRAELFSCCSDLTEATVAGASISVIAAITIVTLLILVGCSLDLVLWSSARYLTEA